MSATLEQQDEVVRRNATGVDNKDAKSQRSDGPSRINNPYLAGRSEWNERYGDLITRAQNWRTAAFISGATSLLLVIGIIAIAMRSHIVPYIIPIDSAGRVINAAPADQASVADERMVHAAIFDWVQAARTVTSDQQAELRLIDKVYSMLGRGAAAQTYVTEYYRANSPFDRARTQTVTVDIHSVVNSSDKTLDVEWQETTRDLDGQVKETETYRGSFTTTINPPNDEQTARLNPLGIYITHANWSKVL